MTLRISCQGVVRHTSVKENPEFETVTRAMQAAFPKVEACIAKYTDEDGDLCTLIEGTLEDFLVTAREYDGDQATLKLELFPAAPGQRESARETQRRDVCKAQMPMCASWEEDTRDIGELLRELCDSPEGTLTASRPKPRRRKKKEKQGKARPASHAPGLQDDEAALLLPSAHPSTSNLTNALVNEEQREEEEAEEEETEEEEHEKAEKREKLVCGIELDNRNPAEELVRKESEMTGKFTLETMVAKVDKEVHVGKKEGREKQSEEIDDAETRNFVKKATTSNADGRRTIIDDVGWHPTGKRKKKGTLRPVASRLDDNETSLRACALHSSNFKSDVVTAKEDEQETHQDEQGGREGAEKTAQWEEEYASKIVEKKGLAEKVAFGNDGGEKTAFGEAGWRGEPVTHAWSAAAHHARVQSHRWPLDAPAVGVGAEDSDAESDDGNALAQLWPSTPNSTPPQSPRIAGHIEVLWVPVPVWVPEAQPPHVQTRAALDLAQLDDQQHHAESLRDGRELKLGHGLGVDAGAALRGGGTVLCACA